MSKSIATNHQIKIVEMALDSGEVSVLRLDLLNPKGSGILTVHTTFGTFKRSGDWSPGDTRSGYNGFFYLASDLIDPDKVQEPKIVCCPERVRAMAHHDKLNLTDSLVHKIVPLFVNDGYHITESTVWSMWAGRPAAIEMDKGVLIRNPNLRCRTIIAAYCRANSIGYREDLQDCFEKKS